MYLKSKKINAFTVSEMLVVLVISSIIISITLVVLNLVQSQIRSIQKVYKSKTEIQFLERGLWQDFNTYKVTYKSAGNNLKFINEIDSVFYTFNKNFVVRNKDTLAVEVFDVKVFLDGNEVKEGAIDAIEIQLSKEIVNKKRFIFKTNDAMHYMQ